MIEFPNINPVAFSIGPFDIRWYALAYLAGILLGWQFILYLTGLDKNKKSYEAAIKKTDIDDFVPWCILGVILGGRLGYVAFYQPDLIWMDPLEIPKVWHGGMSFHGGAIGVILSIILFSIYNKIPMFKLGDLICCAVPIGLFFGRIANFVNGELFGRVTTVPWGVVFPYGGLLPRHPSQIYEALLEGLLLLIILAFLVHKESIREREGFLSGVFLIGYGSARAIVELYREPDVHLGFIFYNLTMGQLLCIPMVLAGVLLIVFSIKRHNELEKIEKPAK
jgi:phosphatidylglycerol:prolipoprotein diacylglycerol transferase